LEKLKISPRAPAVSDRIGVNPASRKNPSPAHRQRDETAFLPFGVIRKDILKGMISYPSSIRNASTGVPADASTSRKLSLAGLLRLAKSKIHTSLTRRLGAKLDR
jgi:hypothetical protein